MKIKDRKFFRKKIKTIFVISLLIPLISFLSGCGGKKEQPSTDNLTNLLQRGIRPNEMGMVMVLEYHRIEEEEGSYTRSIENFKKDLETLYQKGYRLVRLHDLLSGKINVPAGKTPIVLSFDDSTGGQFRMINKGGKATIDSECAMGMMEEFYRRKKSFGYKALFNLLPSLFDQPKYKQEKIKYLIENNFELGDHTMTHPMLSKLSDEEVQKEIAGSVEMIKKIDPKARIDILCLPHGVEPKNTALMFSGSHGGTSYKMRWALLVGSNPFYPLYHYRNPGKLIPRVQVIDYDPTDGSGAEGSEYWLEFFDKNPELRFISDGDPSTICAPAYMESRLLKDKLPAGVYFVGY
ncbi:MAG: polysaccharide deacetylase family protein [Actinomycetota bacterium]|nr:polysaccharide deacetylase family protein [Actinomycetota bacterium]